MYEITYLDKARAKAYFEKPDVLYETLRYIAKKHPAALVPFTTLHYTSSPADSAYATKLERHADTKDRKYPAIGWFGIREIGANGVYNEIDEENRTDSAIVFDHLDRLEKITAPRQGYIAEYYIHHPKVFADEKVFRFLIP